MHRDHERRPLIVCLVSLLELDRPVHRVAADRPEGERWSFRCSRANGQWKVSPGDSNSYVLGGSVGEHWSFYDQHSCTHIEVTGHAGHYHVCDYGGARDLVVTFEGRAVTLSDPALAHSDRFRVEV